MNHLPKILGFETEQALFEYYKKNNLNRNKTDLNESQIKKSNIDLCPDLLGDDDEEMTYTDSSTFLKVRFALF